MNSTVQTARPKASQPLEAANNPAAQLKIETVQALTGLARSTIYRYMREKDFPGPVRQGHRCTRWRAGDVTAWLESAK